MVVFVIFTQFVLSNLKTNFKDVLGAAINISTEELLTLTNQKRQEGGLSTLILNNELSNAAALKAKDMFDKNYWAHNAPDGATPWFFIKNVGYRYLYAGENLARGFTNSPDIVNAWMASQSHRENMLSGNYQEVGFAIMEGKLLGEDTVLVVEMFGNRGEAPLAKVNQNQITSTPSSNVLPKAIATSRNSNLPSIASLKTQPVVAANVFSQNMTFTLLSIFILMFILDMVIIERKKIVRLVGHNIDHIFFFSTLLIVVIIFEKGAIL